MDVKDRQQGNCDILKLQTYHYTTSKVLYDRVTSNGPILDVGCGNGYFTCEMMNRGAIAYGFDLLLSEFLSLVPKDRRKFFVEGNLQAIPFDENFFTDITADNILEHLEHPVQCLLEIRRVLKSNGLLHVLVPLDGINPQSNTLAHCWKFKENEFVDTVLSCGFSLEYCRVFDVSIEHGWILPSCHNQMLHVIARNNGKVSDNIEEIAAKWIAHCAHNIEQLPFCKERRAGKAFSEAKRLSEAGKYVDAIEAFEKVLAINRNFKQVYYEIAECYSLMEKKDRAIVWLTMLLSQINGDHSSARIMLIRLLKETGHLEDARHHNEELKRRNADVVSRENLFN